MRSPESPLFIMFMLHAFCGFPVKGESRADKDAAVRALESGLVQRDLSKEGHFYKVTDKGRMYVEALKATPEPRQTWTCEPLKEAE